MGDGKDSEQAGAPSSHAGGALVAYTLMDILGTLRG